MAIAMTVAGLGLAAFAALSLVTSYFSIRSMFAEEDFDVGHGKALEIASILTGPSLILGLMVGGGGLLALLRTRRRTDADRAPRQRLLGIALGVLLFVALGFLTLALNVLVRGTI